MSKVMLNIIVRSVITVLAGILLVTQREVVMPIIVQCLGIALILPGVIALVSWFVGRSKQNGVTPWVQFITSVASVAMGVWLLLSPGFFVAIFMTVLGIIVMLLGLYQVVSLLWISKLSRASWMLYILPVSLIVLGVLVLVEPFDVASLPFLLLGIGMIVGGVSDLINSIFIIKQKKRYRNIEEIQNLVEDA